MYARQHALDHPDQPAFIMAASGETITFAEYEARCNQVAHLLRAAGLRHGDHISVFMENQLRLLEIEGAAERIGLYYTMINIYLAPDEVAYIVTNSRSRLLFSSAARREVAEAAAAQCPQLERLLMTGPGAPAAGWERTRPLSRTTRVTRSRTRPSARPCSTPRARPAGPRASCATCRRPRPAIPFPSWTS
jgi:long-chain acyl-CoA synthetase